MSAGVDPQAGAVFDLCGRAKLRVSGADALRYLNGQVSNDVRKATAANAVHACVLTTKGRVDADIHVVRDGETFLLDAEPELRETLSVRLERYVIADDVQLEDATDEFALFHLTGPDSLPEVGAAIVAGSVRFGIPGHDLWLPVDHRENALRVLREWAPLCEEDCAETFRIERGVPRWGRELTPEIIPVEANLESAAIDYAKGCYIGQEVISRMKISGQTNKRLCGLQFSHPSDVRPGLRLHTCDDADRDVGWITSVAPGDRSIGLGFVKRPHYEPGTTLRIRDPDARSSGISGDARIVDLPFPARKH